MTNDIYISKFNTVPERSKLTEIRMHFTIGDVQELPLTVKAISKRYI